MNGAPLPLVKHCEECGLDYRRPTGTSRLSDDKWRDRRFCSSTCALSNTGKAFEHANPGSVPGDDSLRLNAARGSALLLTRIMGMYDRIARQRGLNDEWEAAVLLGMAA